METLFTILILALVLYFLQRHYRKFLYRKYELQLHALRDKLRGYVINGLIDADSWTFRYMDSSISKMAVKIKQLNIFHAILLVKTHNEDEKFEDFKKQLYVELERNLYLGEIYKDYQMILNSYLVQKHMILLSVPALTMYGLIRSLKIKSAKLNINESIKRLLILPETSTSEDFTRSKKVRSGHANLTYW